MNFNNAKPWVMHIDLNSCFATIEQQSRPRLRGLPVVVTNRLYDNAVVVTASYEAKAYGIKTGMRLLEARRLHPKVVAIEADPAKYKYIYRRLLGIMQDYSAKVVMKSIDEGVIDFTESTEEIRCRGLVAIGREIKDRLREEVGVWMRCNVGIGTSQFYAKMAAGLHKPDGLDTLTSHNIYKIFSKLELQDLTGIAKHNESRLNAVGIYSPLDMLMVDLEVLAQVFKRVNGLKWYERLRGWEVDDLARDMKTCGRQYVLQDKNISREAIRKLLHNLVEDVGAKLRSERKIARGVRVYVRCFPRGEWQAHTLSPLPFMSNQAIWRLVSRLFEGAPRNISMISVTCYDLSDDVDTQLSIFGDSLIKESNLTQSIDELNNLYGARTIHSADTLFTENIVKPKVPFGSTRYM